MYGVTPGPQSGSVPVVFNAFHAAHRLLHFLPAGLGPGSQQHGDLGQPCAAAEHG